MQKKEEGKGRGMTICWKNKKLGKAIRDKWLEEGKDTKGIKEKEREKIFSFVSNGSYSSNDVIESSGKN